MNRFVPVASLLVLAIRPWAVCATGALGEASAGKVVVGIEQKLGTALPTNTTFTDDAGSPVTLGQLLGKPTILAFVYYTCPNVCDYLLTSLAGTLTSIASKVEIEYNVISISINPAETVSDARKAKRIGLEAINDWKLNSDILRRLWYGLLRGISHAGAEGREQV